MATRLFWMIMVLGLTYVASRAVQYAFTTLSDANTRLRPILQIALWGIAFYLLLHIIFQDSAEGFLVMVGIAALVMGVAAQDVLKNLLGGLVVLCTRPYAVGDRISLGRTDGEITAIRLLTTQIATSNNHVVSVPNAQILSEQVTETDTGALGYQVATDLYLPGWVNVAQAKAVAHEAAASSPYVSLEGPIVVLVEDEFDERFVTHLTVKAHVLDTHHALHLRSDITERSRHAFHELGLLDPAFERSTAASSTAMPHQDPNGQSVTSTTDNRTSSHTPSESA